MQQLLEKALSIALVAHQGETDKAGEPYILHPLRVMLSLNSMEEKIVAILHDVIEDSQVTLQHLTNEGFPEKILQAVALLTKTKGQSYENYIFGIKQNSLATSVKKADLQDNMNIARLKEITIADKERFEKYKSALKQLSD